jgi:hypothetical protein
MDDWRYSQADTSEQLAQLHYYSVVKRVDGHDVTFLITVTEYAAPPPGQRLRFFAQSDKAVNQKTASIVPTGWGDTLLKALADCLRMIRQFPYEGEELG